MKTRWLWAVGLVAVAAALAVAAFALLKPSSPSGVVDENQELIVNGGFEVLGDDGQPVGWTRNMWVWDAGVSDVSITTEAYAGGHAALVVNYAKNDARYEQTVSVVPGGIYMFSCMVRAQNCGVDANGAGLSIADTLASSDYQYDTLGEWTKITMCGKAGTDQKSVTVMVRVGGYGSINTGRAWFDDVSMRRLASAPADTTVQDLTTQTPGGGNEAATPAKDRSLLLFTLAALLFAMAAALAVRRVGGVPELGPQADDNQAGGNTSRAWLVGGLVLAAAIRLFLAPLVRGYPNDMSCFLSWGDTLLNVGPVKFYSANWCDYPPGYILVLAVLAGIRRLFGIVGDVPLAWLVVKLVPIAADIGAAMLIYRLARHRLGERSAVVLSLILALNPASIVNAAAWGQIDSVLALCLAATLIWASEGRWTAALPMYAVSVLIKPQALMFGPIGLFMVISDIIRRRDKRVPLRRALWGAAGALGVLVLVLAPFAVQQMTKWPVSPVFRPFQWVYELYTTTLGYYTNITINAANVYTLFGLNWSMVDIKLSELPWLATGNIAILALSIVYACVIYWRARRRDAIFLSAAVMLSLIFAFGMMMHERYAFPLLILLAMAYVRERDVRILYLLIISSAAQFMNIAMVLHSHDLISDEQAMNKAISLVNVGVTVALAWVGWDVLIRKHVVAPGRVTERPALPRIVRLDAKLNLHRVDWAIMAALTLVYSVVAFVNLGTTAAPQTSWRSSAANEQVTFDLGETRTFHMTYYGGICDSSFTVSLSDDGQTWSDPGLARYDQGEIFRWLWYVPCERQDNGDFNELESGNPMQTARFVRLTTESPGLILSEVAFIDADGKTYPIESVTSSGGDPETEQNSATLVDEQSTVPAYPSYLNGTYFDEIYHARTGYEFLHGIRAYETTHPPLGKVLIMLGIKLFGMTPFGWRFMGALVGVLMIPAMYLMVKQLVKRTDMAAIGAFLMAVDAMHFTQTRIATIDSYGVFFIMLMYIPMFRYLKMNFHCDKLSRTLVPLALSGLLMGLGIASKWIGIYAAGGLAVLLFYSLGRRYLEYMGADRQPTLEAPYVGHFRRNLIVTLLSCVVFFVVVPLLIYYFSYYWFMVPQGGLSIKKVWDAQLYMFDYHSGLTGDTHPFMSKWYTWPFIGKPMWYFSGTEYMPAGVVSSISALGNPAVWWGGLVALIFVLVQACRRRGGEAYLYVLIGFAAQYLPWTLVPRSTFIYHYFASVPFIILCTVFMIDWARRKGDILWRLRINENAFRPYRLVLCGLMAGSIGLVLTPFWVVGIVLLVALCIALGYDVHRCGEPRYHALEIRFRSHYRPVLYTYLAIALVLFIAFYPIMSGMPVSRGFAQCLRWFNWIIF